MSTGGMNLSREFFDLLKAIGESKSKQEEDRIILREVTRLKQQMETPSSSHGGGGTNMLLGSKKRSKEFLVRLLYVEMLGHDGSFGYIKAVEMAASASLYHKRTGYLLCSSCLSPEHEFRFMLVNQMQRDLKSTNILEICGGLLATTSLITSDMVPAVQADVGKLVNHESNTVRKKAIIAMHRLYQLAPESCCREEIIDKLRKVLCDKDPAVMGSCLNVIEAMSNMDTRDFKELIPSLISILKQIGEQRLPQEFNYHKVSAPWIQMKIIRILAILGKADAQASSEMYQVLSDRILKADAVGVNAGYAIVFECIKTIATIYPNPQLLDLAGDAISRFISSRSHNLKYVGITGLSMIVETNPQYAAQHQIAVMDCLEDSDETLQRKTLDLLYRMTNPVNVEFIAERMIEFVKETSDVFLQRVLTTRICAVAERYAPNNAWYIKTITTLFEVSGDMVPHQVAQNLLSLIAEGTGESDEADMLLRQNAVEIYVGMLQNQDGGDSSSFTVKAGKLPRILLETMAWCLGEYGYLSSTCTVETVLTQLCELAKTAQASKLLPTTRKLLLSAIMKLISQLGTCSPEAASVIDEYTKSRDVDLQQRCLEFQAVLTTAPQLLAEIFPVDASAEDVAVDENLSFLDGYVQQSLANGAKQYELPEDDDDDDLYSGSASALTSTASAFNMTPYEKPTKPTGGFGGAMSGHGHDSRQQSMTMGSVALPPGAAGGGPVPGMGAAVSQDSPALGGLNTRNVVNVWGAGGLKQADATPAVAPTAPTPSATGPSSFAANNYPSTGFGASAAASPPAAEVPKTKEQLDKERRAAALFGGIPGAATAPPPAPTPAPASVVAPKPVAVAAPVAPAPVIDLLDLMGFDDPTPATTDVVAPTSGEVDIFAPRPTLEVAAPAPAVETVSDDEDADVKANNTVMGGMTGTSVDPFETAATTPSVASTPAPEPEMNIDPAVDPFEAAGLLGDAPAPSLMAPLPTSSFSSCGSVFGSDSSLSTPAALVNKFEYQGLVLSPLEMDTAAFGQHWGPCSKTTTTSVQTQSVTQLSGFMTWCTKIGLHTVESISATNEGICAGSLGKSNIVVLVHGKVGAVAGGICKIDVTVKTNGDQSMSGSLATYLQTMLR